jgi:hypothetical protein
MAYPDPKGDGDKSMPGKRRSGSGVRDDAPRDPRDMAKAGLPDIPISRRCKEPSVGKIPETGAMLCADIVEGSVHLSERGAMPSEGIQGDEWDAYVTLSRTTRTNVGSPTGREPYGDGVPVVVVGVTTHQGGRESRPQGKGAQVTGYRRTGRYA